MSTSVVFTLLLVFPRAAPSSVRLRCRGKGCPAVPGGPSRRLEGLRLSPPPSFSRRRACGSGYAVAGGLSGRPTNPFRNSLSLPQIGCDRSRSLADICGERRFQALVGDALAVPLRSGSCDACLSIAVIHHLATAVSVASVSPELQLGAGRAPGWLRWTQSQLLRSPRPLPGGPALRPLRRGGARRPSSREAGVGGGTRFQCRLVLSAAGPSVPRSRGSAAPLSDGGELPGPGPALVSLTRLLPACLSSFFKTQVLRSLTHAFNSSQTFLVLKQVTLMFYIFLKRKNSLFFRVSGVSPLT